MTKKILIVCELNVARSKTTEFILNRHIKEKDLDLKVESVGLFTRKLERNSLENMIYFMKIYIPLLPMKKITKEKTQEADKILAMKKYMVNILEKEYNANPKKILCLNIHEKNWCPYSPKLIKIIEAKIELIFP